MAEVSEEAVWLHVSSPLSMSYFLCFSPELVKAPTLLVSNSTSTEHKDAVVMTCYSNAESVQWLFNGRDIQLSETRRLSEDRRSLTIDPIQREDVGYYHCKASNSISYALSWALELHVQHD